ncbi:MAG: class I SAM-dependent methyltransferase [Nannocystaceae bacterium]|nr:class I SAM-dependent methyltransferase [Nannocystaceae bacterium]
MLARFVAAQLRRPSGRAGLLLGRFLNRANRNMNRRAVAHLDVRSGHRLLDIGFGGGVGLDAMMDISQSIQVDGIDFSDAMVRQQTLRLAARIERGQLALHRGDVADLPFGDARFDRVLSVNTIYFWPHPIAGLKQILRVLKPGGRLVLGCATKAQLKRSSATQHGFSHYDSSEVSTLLREAGFSGIEEATPSGEPFFFAVAHRPEPVA